MLYWPIINIAIWGFTSLYVLKAFAHASVMSGIFAAGVLMNEFFFRSTVSIMLMFLEEVWSRNLGHMFASPLSFPRYMTGIVMLSAVRTIVSVGLAIVLAAYLFDFSLMSLGWPAVAWLGLLLVSGWWFGMLTIALLLRFGLAAEWTAWMFTWFAVPLMAPYYPVSILPYWLQPLSWALPPTYVFESMKSLIGQQGLKGDYLLIALGLNLIYLVASAWVLGRAYRNARRRGGLLQTGE
jgi:ABC-2 type transport system permease protein